VTRRSFQPLAAALTVLCLATPSISFGHGGVVLEDDICFIKIGYFIAHFKVYLPDTLGHEDFCEDLPETGNGLFVMEYLNDKLSHVPVEFRIIRNVTDMGRFTNWDDVVAIGDLSAITVLHVAPSRHRDLFTILHRFEGPGEYVGIVHVGPDENGQVQRAVFPFAVGYTDYGYWPFVLLALLSMQLYYMWSTGWFRSANK
jgi:hypothetical protein